MKTLSKLLIGCAVLVAPPNRGSILARRLSKCCLMRRVFGDKSGKELLESGPHSFQSLGRFPLGMPVMVIAGASGHNPLIPGKDDGKVGCWETRLRTDHEYRQIRGGHSWITWSPKAIRIARDFIGRGRPLHY